MSCIVLTKSAACVCVFCAGPGGSVIIGKHNRPTVAKRSWDSAGGCRKRNICGAAEIVHPLCSTAYKFKKNVSPRVKTRQCLASDIIIAASVVFTQKQANSRFESECVWAIINFVLLSCCLVTKEEKHKCARQWSWLHLQYEWHKIHPSKVIKVICVISICKINICSVQHSSRQAGRVTQFDPVTFGFSLSPAVECLHSDSCLRDGTGRWTFPLCYWPRVAPCGGSCCPTIGCVGRSGGQWSCVAGVRLFLLARSRTVWTLRVSDPDRPPPPPQCWSMCKSLDSRRHKGSYEQGFVLVLCQDLVIGFETVPAKHNRKRGEKKLLRHERRKSTFWFHCEIGLMQNHVEKIMGSVFRNHSAIKLRTDD